MHITRRKPTMRAHRIHYRADGNVKCVTEYATTGLGASLHQPAPLSLSLSNHRRRSNPNRRNEIISRRIPDPDHAYCYRNNK